MMLADYLTDIGRFELLSADAEYELAVLAHAGDGEAKLALANANLRWVVKIAKTYLRRGLTLPELVSAGNVGLMRSLDHFDPSFGTRVSTYATYWIKQSIREELRTATRLIHIPEAVLLRMSKWIRVRDEYAMMGVTLTTAELRQKLKLTEQQAKLVEKAVETHGAGAALASLDGDVGEFHRRDVNYSDGMENIREILDNIAALSPRNRVAVRAIRLKYGVDDGITMTDAAVGRALGVSKTRSQQIVGYGLDVLRAALASRVPDNSDDNIVKCARQCI